MPPKGTSSEPPQMTWGKVTPILIVSALFDVARISFALFWLVGPALIALYCSAKASAVLSTISFGLLSTATATAACGAGAAALGAAGFAITAPFGTVMAMAVGFLGWMVMAFWIMKSNRRLITENPAANLWMLGSAVVSEVPIIDVVPILTMTMWRLHKAQIKRDAEIHKKWKEETAKARKEEVARKQQAILAARLQTETANDAALDAEAAVTEEKALAEEELASIETTRERRTSISTVPRAANDPEYRQAA